MNAPETAFRNYRPSILDRQDFEAWLRRDGFTPGTLAELDRLDAKSEQYGYGWPQAGEGDE